jgi:hypothetical protein
LGRVTGDMAILYWSFGESYVGICQITDAIAIPSRLSHQRLTRDNWVGTGR